MSIKFAIGKREVVEQIKKNISEGNLNSKAELNDPNLDKTKMNNCLENFWKNKKTLSYKIKNAIVKNEISTLIKQENIEIKGLENLACVNNTGAIVTSNHFSPIDSLPLRLMVKKVNKRLYTVVMDTNIAMDGPIGKLMNYADTIPVSSTSMQYMSNIFAIELKKVLDKKGWVLIYPEEEMWFNYRKPRPPKRGAYYYAIKNNVPIVSCFLETVDSLEEDTEEFYKLKFILHILPAIFPSKDETLSAKQKEQLLMKQDYEQKKAAYEKAYSKKLDYSFENSDIAGCRFL